MSAEIQKLYIAYFNRPADPGGLAYWTDQLAKGATMTQVANSFSSSAEYQAIYAGKSNLVLIDQLYQNLFGRTAEAGGLLYWANEMAAGRVTITTVASALASGTTPGSADNIAINSKIAAATAFTTAIDTAAEIIAYSNSSAIAKASAWLNTVTNAATLATAIAPAALNTAVASVVSGVTGSAGSNFALTTGTNNFTGTSGNDTFDAGLSTSSLQTLNSGDQLTGGAGTDELFAVINGSVTPAVMSGIETVSVTAVTNAATLDLSNATGVTSVTSAGSTSVLTLAGISKSVGVTLRDSGVAQTITFNDVSGSSDSATVTVANMSQLTTVATSIAGIESLTINATGTSANLGLLTLDKATKLTVTGAALFTVVDNLPSNVITVDATSSTGGVDLDFSGTTMTVSGGSGNDSFSFEAAGDVSVTGGALNDTFAFDATGTYTTADSVSGGDGNDTLSATSANLVTASTSTPTTYTTSGIEKVSVNTALADGGTITLSNIDTSINRLEIKVVSNTDVTAETYVFNAGSSTLELDAVISGGGTQTVSVGGSATTDTLTIINGTTSATNVLNGLGLTSTGFETVTINTTGTGAVGTQTVGAVSITPTGSATSALVVTGVNQLTTGVVTAGTINASGMTAATIGLDMVTGANTA